MDSTLWAKAHGGLTHFPIALLVASTAFDAVGFLVEGRPASRDLRAAAVWTLALAALGSVGAVVSGLLMTKGRVLGHGALRWHHLFVWPAFALLIALATWRILAGARSSRRVMAAYLCGVTFAAGLMLAAGYWGGEMMIVR